MPENQDVVEYRAIPGFPGYRAGSDGTIWTSKRGPWRTMCLHRPKAKELYLRCMLSRNGKTYKKKVHRLVLLAFVGECPSGMQCRHIDGDGGNNRLSNLAWGTQSENEADKARHGRSRTGKPLTAEHRRKLSLARAGKTGAKPNAETRRKLSLARTGIKFGPLTESHRQKISAALTGRRYTVELVKPSPIDAVAPSGGFTGRQHSEATRQRISDSMKGKAKSSSHKANIALAFIGSKRIRIIDPPA